MKNRVGLLTAAILFSVSMCAIKRAFARTDVRYITSNNPNTCRFPVQLPSNCTALVTGNICTTTTAGVVTTYYQGTTCVLVYYQF